MKSLVLEILKKSRWLPLIYIVWLPRLNLKQTVCESLKVDNKFG